MTLTSSLAGAPARFEQQVELFYLEWIWGVLAKATWVAMSR